MDNVKRSEKDIEDYSIERGRSEALSRVVYNTCKEKIRSIDEVAKVIGQSSEILYRRCRRSKIIYPITCNGEFDAKIKEESTRKTLKWIVENMRAENWSEKEIAAAIGVGIDWVDDTINLNVFPELPSDGFVSVLALKNITVI